MHGDKYARGKYRDIEIYGDKGGMMGWADSVSDENDIDERKARNLPQYHSFILIRLARYTQKTIAAHIVCYYLIMQIIANVRLVFTQFKTSYQKGQAVAKAHQSWCLVGIR